MKRRNTMKMLANIRLFLSKLLPIQLLALLDNVIAKLTGNATYPDLPVSLPQLNTMRDDFKKLIEAATGGSVADRKARDKKKLEVQSALRVTADYVRSVANGDAALLALSGFELAKRPEPISMVGVPSKVAATATDASGNLRLRWAKTTGARMFRIEQTSSDPAAGEVKWETVGMVGRQNFVVTGLESYQAYWFRITALGIATEGLPSDVVLGRAA